VFVCARTVTAGEPPTDTDEVDADVDAESAFESVTASAVLSSSARVALSSLADGAAVESEAPGAESDAALADFVSVSSAHAICGLATAEPIPNATARAPTRPTCFA
jgi:hypothetical protein